MRKIKIFLASSNELKAEREKFEIEVYRKCKAWFDQGIFLHLDIWEDLSARMSGTRSQDEYNKKIEGADLFVLLGHTARSECTQLRNLIGHLEHLKTPRSHLFSPILKKLMA